MRNNRNKPFHGLIYQPTRDDCKKRQDLTFNTCSAIANNKPHSIHLAIIQFYVPTPPTHFLYTRWPDLGHHLHQSHATLLYLPFQFIVTLAVLLSAALAAGQFFGDYRSFGFRSLSPDYEFSGSPSFGAPADFGGSANVRDSRQDRGTGNYNIP